MTCLVVRASSQTPALKEIAARVKKARGMNPAELRVIDGSLRQELVNEGFFERFNKRTR